MDLENIQSQSHDSFKDIILELLNNFGIHFTHSLFSTPDIDLELAFKHREYEDYNYHEIYLISEETRNYLSSIIKSESNLLEEISEKYNTFQRILVTIHVGRNNKPSITLTTQLVSISSTLRTQLVSISPPNIKDYCNTKLDENSNLKNIVSDIIGRSEIYEKLFFFLKNPGIDLFYYFHNDYLILPGSTWDTKENIISLMITYHVTLYINGKEEVVPVFLKRKDKLGFLSAINKGRESDLLDSYCDQFSKVFSRSQPLSSGEKMCLLFLINNWVCAFSESPGDNFNNKVKKILEEEYGFKVGDTPDNLRSLESTNPKGKNLLKSKIGEAMSAMLPIEVVTGVRKRKTMQN